MKQRIRILGAWLVLGIAMLSPASGQSLPTLVDDTRNTFSQQAPDAFPPPPPGIDVDPRIPTGSQWKSGTVVGGWLTTRIKDGAGTVLAGSPDTTEGPTTLLLPNFTPRDGDGNVIPDQGVQLESARMARPLAGRVPTVFFGDVIARPLVDNDGVPVSADTFLPEPANAQGGKFYYSPNARSVFATQSGEVNVTWRFRDPARVPATLEIRYTVSASPNRPTRRMFWTEKGFNGPIVTVPPGPVSAVNVIYSAQFPAQVATEYDSPYDVPADPALQLPPEKRTLWYNTLDRTLHCYNGEGRVFVEILGALNADKTTRQFLGSEIVEIIREVAPLKVETMIGEMIKPTVPLPMSEEDGKLIPSVINGAASAPAFLKDHTNPRSGHTDYYAVRTTNQPADKPDQPTGEVLLYWKTLGNYGLKWPKYYQTYIVRWPISPNDYSQYVRQDKSQKPEETGVKLDPENNPVLLFQDDPTGGQAEMINGMTLVTRVGSDPDGRALIQYSNGTSIWFERVQSRLNTDLPNYGDAPAPVDVGQRIDPPAGFESAVGYIRQTTGTAFDESAYLDPFRSGVQNAKQGAIIGVNARPGNDVLEVWWYKANSPPPESGLKPTYWPAAVRKYKLQWPSQPAEIIMASNEGSGELPSLQAAGSIYFQNDAGKIGFNPNDEHAIMAGGRAWALRDDLGFAETSLPYVLLRYKESDDRPAMRVFHVLREKDGVAAVPPSGGSPGSPEIPAVKFDYTVTAGKILQAPMPLPLLPLPLKSTGQLANLVVTSNPSDPSPQRPAENKWPTKQAFYDNFTVLDRKKSYWVYRGPHSGEGNPSFPMKFYYLSMEGFWIPGEGGQKTAGTLPKVGTLMPYLRTKLTTSPATYIGAASGDNSESLPVTFRPVWPEDAPQLRIGETLTLPKYGLPAVRSQSSMQVLYEQCRARKNLNLPSVSLFDPTRAKTYALGKKDEGNETFLQKIPGSVATSDYRGKTWFPNLPPQLSQRIFFDPNLGAKGSLTLIGEFKDEVLGEDYLQLNVLSAADLKAVKGLCPDAAQDPAKTEKTNWDKAVAGLSTVMDTFMEDPAKLGTYLTINERTERNYTSFRDDAWDWLLTFKFTSSLWDLSTVQAAFSSSESADTATLWNWMKKHEADLKSLDADFHTLVQGEVWTEYDGSVTFGYFSGLKGKRAEWHKALEPEYLPSAQAYVRSDGNGQDVERFEKLVRALTDKRDKLLSDLTNDLVTTRLNKNTRTFDQSKLAEVTDPDDAVDSYALSAAGGGSGYVVLMSGNGTVFTPKDEPVSMHILKVTAPLARGELKVIAPSNPLDEKITLQQALDYGAKTEDYEFEWRFAPPVDGLPPAVYTFSPAISVGDGEWSTVSPKNEAKTVSLPSVVQAQKDAASPTWVRTLTRKFTQAKVPLRAYVSLQLGTNDGVLVKINGANAASWRYPDHADTPVVDTAIPGLTPLDHLVEISPTLLKEGANNIIELLVKTTSAAPALSSVNARLEVLQATENLSAWLPVMPDTTEVKGSIDGSINGKNRHLIEGAGIFTLTDNYFICRYRAIKSDNAAYVAQGGWSSWTDPQLAEGWIKRALAGINPFQQRITDLYNNAVNTDVSLLTQAGRRWEGDIALNLENINQFGLIEIYETILRRGKALSIEGIPPLSYGPANDALLLAAGYLNDLYMLVGNEAYADAANPTIAFGTDAGEFGDVATSLFAFKGQLPDVLTEELDLLRGRDDFLPPGTRTAPIYNRLVWNYTRGIDSGEAVYALNYNIKDLNNDGVVSAADAAIAYPQGHGDAYGHYLTALTGYYGLLRNPLFDWMPRTEAVSLLGKPVAVDYFDERKFATAAAALVRTTAQTLDLTYRQAFDPASADKAAWGNLKDGRVNAQTGLTRTWGVDDWASRGGQGSFLHWITANSMLPDVDPNPNHEGIQKIDRSTVPELLDIVLQTKNIQQTLDAADARLNPLGLAGGAMPFDISPTDVDDGKTHFEQIYERAVTTLGNAAAAFDNAKASTQLLRSQEDSLAGQRDAIQDQERAFTAQLIDLYGTPYAEDAGPGKTYPQGYNGPDYYHYMYVDMPELFKKPQADEKAVTFSMARDTSWDALNLVAGGWNGTDSDPLPLEGLGTVVEYPLDSAGQFVKPASFARRSRPGQLQGAISAVLLARMQLRNAIDDYSEFGMQARRLIRSYNSAVYARDSLRGLQSADATFQATTELVIVGLDKANEGLEISKETFEDATEISVEGLPGILGVASDPSFAARAAFYVLQASSNKAIEATKGLLENWKTGLEIAKNNWDRVNAIVAEEIAWNQEHKQLLTDLRAGWEDLEDGTRAVDEALRAYSDATSQYQALLYDAQTVLNEREIARQRAAALIQGFRTRDFGFRAFRNEALESYKSLFDLAARYTFLAARAYDYETGLVDTKGAPAAKNFFQKIVQARALGVLADGVPRNAGSQGGDPGLSGVLARMDGDWSVVRSRLGFNNPDHYSTTFSLRQENERIVPGEAGDALWTEKLAGYHRDNLLDDPNVRRYCMQIGGGGGLTVPGYMIPFSTTITPGFNFFGKPLAGGDSTFTPTSFATKIRAGGIALKGYVGMNSPTSIGGAIEDGGGSSPADPETGFLDPNALSATPYVYLIPTGSDSMRAPALNDASVVRSWSVQDQAIALPFDIGGADINKDLFTPGQSLSEPFTIRKHQAFRAVPDGTVFNSLPGFTNSRLIGRSVWNSKWMIVIPDNTLLADPAKGREIFEQTVKDIKLHLETYSYSGN